MQPRVNEDKFTYKPSPFYRLAHCRIRLYKHDGRQVVVASEVADNPGMSVTNAAEDLATQVVAYYKLDIERLIWIEHYPADRRLDAPTTFDLVRFTWAEGTASDPEWRRLTFEEVERLTGDDHIAGESL
jgi:hypothetical protein